MTSSTFRLVIDSTSGAHLELRIGDDLVPVAPELQLPETVTPAIALELAHQLQLGLHEAYRLHTVLAKRGESGHYPARVAFLIEHGLLRPDRPGAPLTDAEIPAALDDPVI